MIVYNRPLTIDLSLILLFASKLIELLLIFESLTFNPLNLTYGTDNTIESYLESMDLINGIPNSYLLQQYSHLDQKHQH